jgi:hypothetical protein
MVQLSRREGVDKALRAGVEKARGEAVLRDRSGAERS